MRDLARSVAFFDVVDDIRTMARIGKGDGAAADTPAGPTLQERLFGKTRRGVTKARPGYIPAHPISANAEGYPTAGALPQSPSSAGPFFFSPAAGSPVGLSPGPSATHQLEAQVTFNDDDGSDDADFEV